MARNKPDKPKIFCIGWHKTGTSTMGQAFWHLGYSILGCRLDMAPSLLEGTKEVALELAAEFDVLQDLPWAALYKDLDEMYPGSKFILTSRPERDWLNSASKHFKCNYCSLHEWAYTNGVMAGNEELYVNRYLRHNREVRKYFQGRDDFMEMDFHKGDGWSKLCSFIGEPIPAKAFPHANKGKHNYTLKEKLIAGIRYIVPEKIRRKRVEILEDFGLHNGRNRFNNMIENRAWREKKP